MSTLKSRIANNTRYSLQEDRLVFMPKILCDKAIIIYLFALMGCVGLYSKHILSLQWWIFGLVCVLGFFNFANRHTKLWVNTRPIAFTKKLFWTAFALRVLWVLISYGLYHNLYKEIGNILQQPLYQHIYQYLLLSQKHQMNLYFLLLHN